MADRREAPPPDALGAAVVFCEGCGKETVHRILRLDPVATARTPTTLGGVARCRECRLTHPFVSTREARAAVSVVVSRGPSSERRRVELPSAGTLRVGEPIPEADPRVVIHRIDLADGTPVTSALAREVRTLWAVEEEPRRLRVAVLQGARSSTERLDAVPGVRLCVGDSLQLPSGPVTIVALRARDRTWRRRGDAFAATEVAVVYGRRTVRPPAGRSPWRRERGTSSSRESSSSRAARSRSFPGESRKRTEPRA